MKTKISLLTVILLGFLSGQANAQLIVTNPAFPAESSLVEITYNAALGNGGLAGYTGDVYAHTGVITNQSTGPADWKYVKTNWGQNSPATKLERIGVDLYKLTVTPGVRQYYGVPAAEQILKMAFVFRSGVQVDGSWLEGKTESGSDIFVDIYPNGLFVRFDLPSENELLVLSDEIIQIQATSNSADSLFLFYNQTQIKAVAGNLITESISATGNGKQYIYVVAKNQTEEAVDSFYYFVRQPVTELELPEGIIDGINYLSDTSAILSLFAPGKEFAFVIGDFNEWQLSDSGYMNRTPDGNHFWTLIDNLEPGLEYIFQYFVDGTVRIGDPYAEKVSDPWNDQYISETTYPGILPYPTGKTTGVATVLQTAQQPYIWEIEYFTPPAKEDMVVYELLIRDFLATHNYQGLIDTLGYLKGLGVNTIELMPFNEFEGNLSWGYNPNFYFAPDKYYGPANDLRRFIDVCHENGIAVIMDMVLNHSFGTSPMVMLYWDAANNRPAENNPWFNPVAKHDYNVGFDFNHESAATKQLVSRVVRFWLENYKIDGYRFDLSKGFTQKNTLGNIGAWGQYDATRVAIWKSIADTIWSVKPDARVILEHFADNTEEKILANYGMMIWGKASGDFANAARGASTNTNFSWASYQARGWNEPNLISYMESHDEERMMYRIIKEGINTNPQYRIRDTTIALERVQLANLFFYAIPGPKMLWQFGELGYDYSIDFNGRTGEKPIRWDYLTDYRRHTLNNVVKEMIKLKKEHNAFRTTDFTLDVSGFMKKIILKHPDMSVVVLGNFNVTEGNIVPGFPENGKWYEYFSGDSIAVTAGTDPITLQAGEYRLYTNSRLTKPETGIGIEESETAENVILGSAYPNPSESLFTIPVNIRHQMNTSLHIYDVTGRVISTLYNGNLMPGLHEFTWNSSGNKPGIYFLKLVSDKKTESEILICR